MLAECIYISIIILHVYTHYHDHTVQVAMHALMCLCTSVSGQVVIQKNTTITSYAGDDHHERKFFN